MGRESHLLGPHARKKANSPFGIIASPLFNSSLCSSACLCQIILATSIPTALMPHGIYEESGLNALSKAGRAWKLLSLMNGIVTRLRKAAGLMPT